MKRLAAILFCLFAFPAFAHEHGRTDQNWEEMSDDEREWLLSLKMPDNESLSCCGLGDQYRCSSPYVRDRKTYCKITDDRDDKRFNRPHVPIGTEIEIPDEKLKWQQGGKPIGNPTGFPIVFMGAARIVYCFINSTGI